MLSIALWSVLALAPAQTNVSGCRDLSGQPITPNVSWPVVWQALNTQANCTQNCHVGNSSSAGLDLSNERFSLLFMVGQSSSQADTLRVDAGAPENSLFFNKINCSQPGVGGAMPPGGSISMSLQALIFDWIEQGAYGESKADSLSRDFIFRDGAESERRARRAQ
jgi:hypothetical protein